jgi:hypothetical protein
VRAALCSATASKPKRPKSVRGLAPLAGASAKEVSLGLRFKLTATSKTGAQLNDRCPGGRRR